MWCRVVLQHFSTAAMQHISAVHVCKFQTPDAVLATVAGRECATSSGTHNHTTGAVKVSHATCKLKPGHRGTLGNTVPLQNDRALLVASAL